MHVIVVLGSPNDESGVLSEIAISRCDLALDLFLQHSDAKLLCTGGFGAFNTTATPHAVYAKNYLMGKGLPSSCFLEIVESAFTLEDATLAKPVLDRYTVEAMSLVTSDFHMDRAHLVFSATFPGIDIRCCGAATNLPDAELSRLAAHEIKAIARERANLGLV